MYEDTEIEEAINKLRAEIDGPPLRKIEEEYLAEEELGVFVWLEPEAPAAVCEEILAKASKLLFSSLPQELGWSLLIYRGLELVASFNPRFDQHQT
jgi:hypothetical protein